MNATPLIDERQIFEDWAFAEIVVWRVPVPVKGSAHDFKYRLAYIENGVCVIRFDNEAGKGDHAHIGEDEKGYSFTTIAALFDDFEAAVKAWRTK